GGIQLEELAMSTVTVLRPQVVRHAERQAAQTPVQKILVVVDLNATSHAGLEKAARIASAFGSTIELFSCDDERTLPESWAGGTTLGAYRGLMRERHMADLEKLAGPLRRRGLNIVAESQSKAAREQAIVERAIRIEADLVVKDVERHPQLGEAHSR